MRSGGRVSVAHEVFAFPDAPGFSFRWWPGESHNVWVYRDDVLQRIIDVPLGRKEWYLSGPAHAPVVTFPTYTADDARRAARVHLGRVMRREAEVARFHNREKLDNAGLLLSVLNGMDKREARSAIVVMLENPSLHGLDFEIALDAAIVSASQAFYKRGHA